MPDWPSGGTIDNATASSEVRSIDTVGGGSNVEEEAKSGHALAPKRASNNAGSSRLRGSNQFCSIGVPPLKEAGGALGVGRGG